MHKPTDVTAGACGNAPRRRERFAIGDYSSVAWPHGQTADRPFQQGMPDRSSFRRIFFAFTSDFAEATKQENLDMVHFSFQFWK